MTAATLRYEDLDWVIRELTRMRERGSRTFLLPSEPLRVHSVAVISSQGTESSGRCFDWKD